MQQDMDSRNQAGQTSSVSNSCPSEVPSSRDVAVEYEYEWIVFRGSGREPEDGSTW